MTHQTGTGSEVSLAALLPLRASVLFVQDKHGQHFAAHIRYLRQQMIDETGRPEVVLLTGIRDFSWNRWKG